MQEDDGRPIEAHEQSFKRMDSDDDFSNNMHGQSHHQQQTSMVYVPNQSNAFFASGFKMVDCNAGELENIYQNVSERVYDTET